VHAQDVVVALFHDQLAEALGVPVDHGPEQVVVADDRDRAVVAFASLGLGQPDAGVFGVGELPVGTIPGRIILAGDIWSSPIRQDRGRHCGHPPAMLIVHHRRWVGPEEGA
jgi:hypothetical protein